jgi:hypothetical protein
VAVSISSKKWALLNNIQSNYYEIQPATRAIIKNPESIHRCRRGITQAFKEI